MAAQGPPYHHGQAQGGPNHSGCKAGSSSAAASMHSAHPPPSVIPQLGQSVCEPPSNTPSSKGSTMGLFASWEETVRAGNGLREGVPAGATVSVCGGWTASIAGAGSCSRPLPIWCRRGREPEFRNCSF